MMKRAAMMTPTMKAAVHADWTTVDCLLSNVVEKQSGMCVVGQGQIRMAVWVVTLVEFRSVVFAALAFILPVQVCRY